MFTYLLTYLLTIHATFPKVLELKTLKIATVTFKGISIGAIR